jgi:hypothetical protein
VNSGRQEFVEKGGTPNGTVVNSGGGRSLIHPIHLRFSVGAPEPLRLWAHPGPPQFEGRSVTVRFHSLLFGHCVQQLTTRTRGRPRSFGPALLDSYWLKVLDAEHDRALELLRQAEGHGLARVRSVGDVIEVSVRQSMATSLRIPDLFLDRDRF